MASAKKKKEPWWLSSYGRPPEIVWRGARFVWRPEHRSEGQFQLVARFAGGEIYLWADDAESFHDHWDNMATWKKWIAQFSGERVDQIEACGKTPHEALDALRVVVSRRLGAIVAAFQKEPAGG